MPPLLILNDAGQPPKDMVQQFVVLMNASGVREAVLEDRPHLVVPAVMMAEGVWSGSHGPVFYPAQEFRNTAPTWDTKPVVVYHPKERKAAVPEVLSSSRVGILLNTRWEDDKLKTEVWLDVARCDAVDPRVLKAVRQGRVMEVSTGLLVDGEMLTNEAEYGGKPYRIVARNFRPDHLALLPDQVGAFSVRDGGGLLVNSAGGPVVLPLTNDESLGDRMDRIRRALYDRFRNDQPGYYWEGWVEAVFPGYLVYSVGGELFGLDYTATDEAVSWVGDPYPVVRVTEYRKATGEYVGNAAGRFTSDMENQHVDKTAKVGWLIANAGYQESDRADLMATPDKVLNRTYDDAVKAKQPAPPVTNGALPGTTPTLTGGSATPPPAPQPAAGQQTISWEDLKTRGDDRTKQMVLNFEATYNTQVANCLGVILKAPNCPYGEAELRAMPLDQLQKIAALVGNSQPLSVQPPPGMQVGNFLGAGGAFPSRQYVERPITEEPIEDLDIVG